jgi:hypothetical protein
LSVVEIAYKKPFCVTDFGMCYLEDLVNEVKDNKELVVEADKDIIKLYRKGKIYCEFEYPNFGNICFGI